MKKKPNAYTRAGRSNVTLKNFLNNLKENDLHFENNHITQCVFLGVLRLKPVPSMFCTSSTVSTDSLLEVKNTNKRNRRVGNNNNNKELNKNSNHKGDINKVISGRVSKKDTIKVKRSVKKVPNKQTILKVNFKMNEKQEVPSTAGSCLSSSIILSDTKIIPRSASFSKNIIEDQSISNPVQNLFNKLKQQIDERNHQQESCSDCIQIKKPKSKAGKKKTLQDRLPMPLQSGSPNIEVDSDSSGFKDDGVTCSSSDTNSISPDSQNSLQGKVYDGEIILIQDGDAPQNDDVVILDEPTRSLLSVDTSQNKNAIASDSPRILRVSPRTKKVDETKYEFSTNMRELKITVPTNNDNDNNNPSTSLLQTFIQTSDSNKPKKRRRLLPIAMPSIFFNTPMLLRSELAQKKGAQVDVRTVAKTVPRSTKSEIKQEKSVLKQKKDQSPEKTQKNESPKNNDNLIYEVVKSSNLLETACANDKEIIVIDDMPPKVEPLILKLRVSQQKASTSKEIIPLNSVTEENIFCQANLSCEKLKQPQREVKSVAPLGRENQRKQVSIEQNKVVEKVPDQSQPDENQVHCIVIEDDDKTSGKSEKITEKTSSDDIIIVVDEDHVKLIDSEPVSQHKVTLVEESVLKNPQNNDSIIKSPETFTKMSVIEENNLIDSQDKNFNPSKNYQQKVTVIKESVLRNVQDNNSNSEVILIEMTDSKKTEQPLESSEQQNTVVDITEPEEKLQKFEGIICLAEKSEDSHPDSANIDKKEDTEIINDVVDIKISENTDTDLKTNDGEKGSFSSKTTMHELSLPLLATSRILRSEKTQQNSTEQKCCDSSAGQAKVDAEVTVMKVEEPHSKISDQKNDYRSIELQKKIVATFIEPASKLLRSEKSQSKSADHVDKNSAVKEGEGDADNRVDISPEATAKVLRSEITQKNKTIVVEKIRREEYINPPEATSRVLRSEKSQQIPSAQKNNESELNYIIPLEATARVLRSEKIQQNVSAKSFSHQSSTIGTETKSKICKPKEKAKKTDSEKISNVKNMKPAKSISPKISMKQEKLDEIVSVGEIQVNKLEGNRKRPLRSSSAPVISDSLPSSETNEIVALIHEEPKLKNIPSESEVKTLDCRKTNSRRSRQVSTRKTVQNIEKTKTGLKKRSVGSKVSAANADKEDDMLPKKKKALKKHEKNKKIMQRVLRSSENKNLQPGLARDISKPELKTPKRFHKPQNNKGKSVVKQDKSVLLKSRITKMTKLRTLVSIKTKRIAKEKMVNWKNNEIIEEIIQELKNTIFKCEPEDVGFESVEEEEDPNAAGGGKKSLSKKKMRVPKRKIAVKGKQKNKSTGNKTKNTRSQIQKRISNIEAKRKLIKKEYPVVKGKKKTSASLRNLTNKVKEKSAKKLGKKQQNTVDEEKSEEPKIAPRRTTGRSRKIENVIQENAILLNDHISSQKSIETRASSRRSSRNINVNEKNIDNVIEAPKKVDKRINKEQQLKNAAEPITPMEVDGTALIIEVDGSLNEKKKEETIDNLSNEEITVAIEAEDHEKMKITSKQEGKRKTPPASSSEEKPKIKQLKQSTTQRGGAKLPSKESSGNATLPGEISSKEAHGKINNPPVFSPSQPAERKNEDLEPAQQVPKKHSIIIHDDIVLPEEMIQNPAAKPSGRPTKCPDPDCADKKGDIAIFDFEESEPEVAPLRHKPSIEGNGTAVEPTKNTKEKLWSRINVGLPSRRKKMWSVVEKKWPHKEKKYAVVLDEDDFVGTIPQPSMKSEASKAAAEAVAREKTIARPEAAEGVFARTSSSAATPASPVKAESPLKQLTITEMFSKFSKKTDPPPKLALDDCQQTKNVQLESSAGPSETPITQSSNPVHPGPSEEKREDSQLAFMPPPRKTEIRRYSRIDNAEDDDSDCESRAEWVPEEYAEYKFKYSAHKMMQIKPVYKCKVCLALLPSYYKMVKHKKCHENVDNPYNCAQCGALFNNVDDFSAHLRAHKGKHPYECLKCSMGFWTKQAYEEHAPVHVLRKQKPLVKRFRCDICAKEFSKLCDVERHTRVHTGEKPCVCNICNKGFQQSHNLSKHLLTHLHIKPFQCEICNRQFGRNDVLNRHLLTHSIEKPVKCWVCSKGFIRHTQLVVHLLNHHPNHPIEDPNQASAPDEGEEERKTDEEEEEEEADKVRSK